MTNVYNGVPHDHQASGLFPSDPTNSYFFYYDGTINKVYKHNSTSNTTYNSRYREWYESVVSGSSN